ncbi:hypothetical protein M430DRAFT_102989 [Amorphotheca resinae ATCC 22711]|uniref:Sequence orphan n=1 Tax=Amorphotheca resinae ATCC 22711 TaxID=857342 RepID=A0A2T3AZQ9_AMORE|nr:hypothetical protein M430DRAFT_102989 [Amorphotheca resinae ATCC 22711]PSS16647.1 hypothetical protein M430DRAFT_102989 [Amorphotheca resinae ATCC 22711]
MDPDGAPRLVTGAPDVSKPLAEQKVWNTKHLGLRLASDFTSGFLAAGMVAPFITIIDKAIMQNASGQNTLKNSLKTSITSFLLRPHNLLFSKPFGLICMLYGGTYFTANTLDTITSTVQNKPSSLVTSGTTKFAASSTANIGLCLFKDQAFARLFGPGGPPRPVPLPSYVLFAFRDCLTIFASFNVPPILGPVISRNMSTEIQKSLSGQTIAQFLAPASVQIISTPMHLLGLDLYNRGGKEITWGDRWAIIKKNWSVSAVARICRIVPAFGCGGVVNAKVRKGLMGRLE